MTVQLGYTQGVMYMKDSLYKSQVNSSNTGRTVQGQGRFILVYMVQVDELYTAMRTFDDILNDERNHIKIKMKPGDLVSLKNKAEEHLHKQNWLENLG